MSVVQRVSGVELQDPDGRVVRLGSLWQDETVVLVFLRHFG